VISVIIPVKDGGEDLRRCLDGIERQKLDEPVEVVVADSGSTDDSREVAASRGARVLDVGASDFLHGATRNVAAEAANGDLLVFTTQDAYAADENWLARLSSAVRTDDSVAGAYGRQIARESASPPERFFLEFLYGPEPRVQRAADRAELTMHTTLFSNVNSAIRRDVWEQFPFADDLFFSEDQDWARRALLAGHALVYEPAAAVHHSHAYTVKTAFKRFFDTGAAADRGFLAGGPRASKVVMREALRYARDEVFWLARTGRPHWIPYAAVYELAKFAGLQLGARHERLPLWAKRRFSFYPDYWDRHHGRA
jgi:rhamnosyltransferase